MDQQHSIQVDCLRIFKPDCESSFLVHRQSELEDSKPYLGERLRFMLIVTNHSNTPVYNVSVKAQIKSKRSEVTVLDTDTIVANQVKASAQIDDPLRQFAITNGPGKLKGFTFEAMESKEFVINITISDIGQYKLFIHVGYELESGIGYRFEKYVKFEALKALKLTTNLHKVPNTQFMWIAELQVNNMTQEHVLLDKVLFHAQPKFIAKNLNNDLST